MLDRANEARRKAESKELFTKMLKNKHQVVTPDKHKGTRSANNKNAIRDSRDNW